MVLKTKLSITNIGNKYINFDNRFKVIDLDIYRISQFILDIEKQKYNTIKDIYKVKIDSLYELKTQLNLKRKLFIDMLRTEHKNVSENLLNSLILDKKQINLFNKYQQTFIDLLIKYKVIKTDNIGYQIKINLFFNCYNSFIKIINISNDIKTIEICINEFKENIKEIEKKNPYIYGNEYSKINQLDIDYLNNFHNKKITTHIKEILYFYLIKSKKVKISKNSLLNDIGKFKLNNGLINESDINKLIEINHQENIENINKQISKRIDIFYNFIINKWF